MTIVEDVAVKPTQIGERIEIFGYLRIGTKEEPFEFRGTLKGAPTAPSPAPPAQLPEAALQPPESLPRKGQGKLCVNCNERPGLRVLVRTPRNQRAVPRTLCNTCVANLYSAGEIVAIEKQ